MDIKRWRSSNKPAKASRTAHWITVAAVALATALFIYSAASARADPGIGLTDQVTSASETLIDSTAALTDIAHQAVESTAADLPVSTSITAPAIDYTKTSEPTTSDSPASPSGGSVAAISEPIKQPAEPVKEVVEPAKQTIEPVEQALEPVKQTVEPAQSAVTASQPVTEAAQSLVQEMPKVIESATGAVSGEPVENASTLIERTVESTTGSAAGEAVAGIIQQTEAATTVVVDAAAAIALPSESIGLEPVGEVLTSLTPSAKQILEPVTTPLAETLAPLTPAVSEVLGPVTSVLTDTLTPLPPVTEVLEPVLQPISEVLEPVLVPVTEILEPVQPVSEVVADVTAPLITVVSPLPDPTTGAGDPGSLVSPVPAPSADALPGVESGGNLYPSGPSSFEDAGSALPGKPVLVPAGQSAVEVPGLAVRPETQSSSVTFADATARGALDAATPAVEIPAGERGGLALAPVTLQAFSAEAAGMPGLFGGNAQPDASAASDHSARAAPVSASRHAVVATEAFDFGVFGEAVDRDEGLRASAPLLVSPDSSTSSHPFPSGKTVAYLILLGLASLAFWQVCPLLLKSLRYTSLNFALAEPPR